MKHPRAQTPEARHVVRAAHVELRLQSLTSTFWRRRGDPSANGYTSIPTWMSPGTRASSLLPHKDQRLHFFMAFIAFGGAAAFAAFIAFIAMAMRLVTGLSALQTCAQA